MAGPGGGPPRRSHTKSRKGCDACKRRHIRCDETFPQCRNCTKHKIRCPYNDIPVEDRAGTPDKPNLGWTPEIEATIEQWKSTGLFPFPSLSIYPTPDPAQRSTDELRLIHHVAAISHEMMNLGASEFTLWTRQIPTIIKIGATHGYVLHALLAFSAMHLAYLTDCPLVGNLGYEHRGIALKGLHDAIGNFSRENSDAILAASLVLSWQATDWRSWTQLMQGTSSVIEAMEPWKHESEFTAFINESSTFPTAPPSPAPDHKPSQPRQEDIEAYDRTMKHLQTVETFVKQKRGDTKAVAQLISFLKGARKVSPTLSVSQQFERLRPLRTWLFYLPVNHLEHTRCSDTSLVIIASYYAVALVMERLFPEIGAAYFGSMTIEPVEQIARLLYQTVGLNNDAQNPCAHMQFPIEMVEEFRHRMGWDQPARTQSFPNFDGFYVCHDSPMVMPVTTGPEYMPYGNNLAAFSYSTEDLSLVMPDGPPNNAASPLQLSSPYANQQYLSIPSPSYGAVYSPASSTFGDFEASPTVYSDTEEYCSYEAGYSVNSPMLGGSHAYGGFVSPIQTQAVWT